MAKKTLSKGDILHLGELAGLELEDNEIIKYEKQLGETLNYVENLKEIKTEGAAPTDHVTNTSNVAFKDGSPFAPSELRRDKEQNKRGLSKEQVFANTKNKKKDYFVVKRILE